MFILTSLSVSLSMNRMYPTLHISRALDMYLLYIITIYFTYWQCVCVLARVCIYIYIYIYRERERESTISCNGARGGAVGWGTVLQVARLRFRFPMVSLEFYIILPAALWPWGTRSISGGGGGRADNLTTFMCQLSWNLGASTSWKPLGLSRPVMALLLLFRKMHSPTWPVEAETGSSTTHTHGVPGGKDLTSGECSLGQTIPI
jgi:hypothetical protein